MTTQYNLDKAPNLSAELRRLTGSSYDRRSGRSPFKFRFKGAAIIIFLVLLVAFVFLDSIYTIEEGFVGVRIRDGRHAMEEVMPGIHFRIPFVERIQTVDVRLRAIKYADPERASRDEKPRGVTTVFYKEPITVLDKKGREMDTELNILYQLKPHMAAEVISEYGDNWDMKLVHPSVLGAVKHLAARFEAEELATNRSEVPQLLSDAIYQAVSNIDHNPFQISAIELTDTAVQSQTVEEKGKFNETLARLGGGISQTAHVTEPEITDEQEHVDAPEDSNEPQPMPLLVQAKAQEGEGSIQVDLHFCEAVEKIWSDKQSAKWELRGQAHEFASDVGKVACYTRIRGFQTEVVVKHRWFWENQMLSEVSLDVKSIDWRTYSEKTVLTHQTGTWRVEVVVAEDNATLATGSFLVK